MPTTSFRIFYRNVPTGPQFCTTVAATSAKEARAMFLAIDADRVILRVQRARSI